MTKKYVCPNCGSKHGLRFLTCTAALFEITDDGEIGRVSLCSNSIDYMNECASFVQGNVMFECLDCHSRFNAYLDDNNEWQINDCI